MPNYDIESQTPYPAATYRYVPLMRGARSPGPSRDHRRRVADGDEFEMVALVPHHGPRNGERPLRAVRFQEPERGEASRFPERNRVRRVRFQEPEPGEASGSRERNHVPHEASGSRERNHVPHEASGSRERNHVPHEASGSRERNHVRYARIQEPRGDAPAKPGPNQNPHDTRWVLATFFCGAAAGTFAGVYLGSMLGSFWGSQSEGESIRVAAPAGLGVGLIIAAIVVAAKECCCRR